MANLKQHPLLIHDLLKVVLRGNYVTKLNNRLTTCIQYVTHFFATIFVSDFKKRLQSMGGGLCTLITQFACFEFFFLR